MIRNGVKITPENAPFDDFELRLISNEDSPYGFSSICKRNKNKNEWEYSGFGHSGAASIVTALLKELSRKEQECEELKKYLNQIRDEELSHLDIEWNEYETSVRQEDYSNIITLVERALGEIDD